MKRAVSLVAVLLFLTTSTVNAAVSDEEFQEVKDLLQQALARIEQLEASNAQTNSIVAELAESNVTTAAAVATLAESNEQTTITVAQIEAKEQTVSSWEERISWSGDFRYRYQYDEIGTEPEDRNRQRIRARPAMTASLTETIDTVFGIATGGDDPVSANQTLGNGASSKRINLDLAYFDWEAINNLNIRGGKFKNTFESPGTSRMQWDADWRPEGFDVAYKGETFFAQFLGTWLESDSDRSQEYAWIAQAGGKFNLGPAKLKAGLGYTDIGAAGRECFFGLDDFDRCFGNDIDPGTDPVTDPATYLFDFEVYNVFAELGFDVGEFPVIAWVDYIKNDAAPLDDQGYQLGFQLGKTQNRGSWQVKYYYQDLEANATLGLLANSDFGGGGTDSKGSFIQGAYATTDRTDIKLTYYTVEKNQNMNPAINGGAKFDWDTLFVDFNFKYK